MQLDRTEARVLGALLEKEYTTPDVYPLTLNALRAACNQKSNRDPVLDLRDFEIEGCLLRLRERGLARVVERVGSRTPRYSGHLADEAGLSRPEAAIVAELLLRGDQAAGELARRCGRMADYAGPDEVAALLRGLAERGRVRRLPRGPGQRHARWTQLLCSDRGAAEEADETPAAGAVPEPPAWAGAMPIDVTPSPGTPSAPSLREELAALRDEVAELQRRVAQLEAAGSVEAGAGDSTDPM